MGPYLTKTQRLLVLTQLSDLFNWFGLPDNRDHQNMKWNISKDSKNTYLCILSTFAVIPMHERDLKEFFEKDNTFRCVSLPQQIKEFLSQHQWKKARIGRSGT